MKTVGYVLLAIYCCLTIAVVADWLPSNVAQEPSTTTTNNDAKLRRVLNSTVRTKAAYAFNDFERMDQYDQAALTDCVLTSEVLKVTKMCTELSEGNLRVGCLNNRVHPMINQKLEACKS